MPQMGRPGLSAQQKAELWARWKAGESLSDIGRALGKHAASVFGVLLAKGGIAPLARKRPSRSLTLREREEISRGLIAGLSLRRIAGQLGRSPSTISREVDRNQGRYKYRATMADERAWREASRPKPCLLAANKVSSEGSGSEAKGPLVTSANIGMAHGRISRRWDNESIP